MKNLWLITIPTAAVAVKASNDTFLQCLQSVFGDDTNLYSLPEDQLFLQGDVTPYNLDYLNIPAAIISPKTRQQVSQAVKCAHVAGVAVQARSGGHSYANYGKAESTKKTRDSAVANNCVTMRTGRLQRVPGSEHEEHGCFQLQ